MIYNLNMKRSVSLLVPYTADLKILLQDRKSISKFGEEWGYFGGGIEENETPLDAVIRETEEELGLTLEKEHFTFIGEDVLSGITPQRIEAILDRKFYAVNFEKIENRIIVSEGDGMKLFTITEAKQLNMFYPGAPSDPMLDQIGVFFRGFKPAHSYPIILS